MRLIEPLVGFDDVDLAAANRLLIAWSHKMGPINRPNTGKAGYHVLTHLGTPVALVVTESLIAPNVAGLSRAEAIELARVCAARPGLCRVVVRLWREFVFPAWARSHGVEWGVSYQDAAQHKGDLYRFDGWVPIGRSSSGSDPRSGRTGRRKVIWGWHPDPAVRASRRLAGAA